MGRKRKPSKRNNPGGNFNKKQEFERGREQRMENYLLCDENEKSMRHQKQDKIYGDGGGERKEKGGREKQ